MSNKVENLPHGLCLLLGDESTSVLDLAIVIPVPSIEKFRDVANFSPIFRRQVVVIAVLLPEFLLVLRNLKSIFPIVGHVVIPIVWESDCLACPSGDYLNCRENIIPVRVAVFCE